MTHKKIVIAGGTGFIGDYLTQKFEAQGYQVFIISRKQKYKNTITWENKTKLVETINGAEILINLAGKSVDCRYTKSNKKKIKNSRVDTTRALGQAIVLCQQPPRLWINSSTATIYRHAEDRPMTESDGEIGSGFSVEVAKAWEQAFFDFKLRHSRQVALRIAIVLGDKGGALRPLKTLTKLGLGGKQGNGKQVFSWIHIEDLYQIILFLQKNEKLKGIFNCSTPNPVTNSELMNALREKLKALFGIPSPVWLLKFGAILIRTEVELILKSRWVLPERLLQEGFTFTYPNLNDALEDILKK
ncbi:MAG: TIGR01777 family oxidoreductase [Bernardetiaceae bacterium]|nr:TIGR01777 family oxidoreductase [Bernardetiaceae bacterium]